MEKWLPVLGYEGLYEVSDQGRVRSLPRPGTRGGVLKGDIHETDGYPCVRLSREGVKRHLTVHGLVAAAFLGPRPEEMEVRHLNGDPADNWISNLKYGTSGENSQDMVLHGRTNARITHCPSGHEYNTANTYHWGGRRYCRPCNRTRTRVGHQRRRAAARAPGGQSD